MRRRILYILLAAVLAVSLVPGTALANGGASGTWKYKVVVAPQYENVGLFGDNGFAAAEKDELWGYIDQNGTIELPFQYEDAGIFNEGSAFVKPRWYKADGSITFYDPETGAFYAVIDEKGNISPIPRDHSIVICDIYNDIKYTFHDGYGCIQGYSWYGDVIIDDGTWKFPIQINNGTAQDAGFERYLVAIGPFSEGLFPVSESDDETGWGIFAAGWVDSEYNWEKRFEWYEGAENYISGTGAFQDGLAPVWQAKKDEKTGGYKYQIGFMNRAFEWVIPPQYDTINYADRDGRFSFGETGLAVVGVEGKYGAIDKTGKTVIPFQYDDLRNVSDGAFAFQQNGKWGFLDGETCQVLIPAQYEYAGDFWNGIAPVYNNGTVQIIDKSGQLVDSLSQLDLSYYIRKEDWSGTGDYIYYSYYPLSEYVVIKENGLYGFAKLTCAAPVQTDEMVSGSDGKSLEWTYLSDNTVEVAGDMSSSAPVLVTSYDENGKMLSLTWLTEPGAADVTGGDTAKIFWLESDSGTPKAANVEIDLAAE